MQRWENVHPDELARPAWATCRHCGRDILQVGGRWVDPEATGDDAVWRETCDEHDTFDAVHEPQARPAHVAGRWWTHPLVVVSVLFWAAVTAGVYFGMIR